MQIIALDLESVLEQFETLPFALSFHPDLARVLEHPDDRDLLQRVNLMLQLIQRQSRVNAIYMMDRDGNTLVASNWDQPLTFVGKNFGFRPYFRDALKGGAGRFYGIGSTTSEPGYFIAQPVYRPNVPRAASEPIGVITVQLALPQHAAARQRDATASGRHAAVCGAENLPDRFAAEAGPPRFR